MRMKKTILSVLATFIVCTAWAQAPREEIFGAAYCDPVTLLWQPLMPPIAGKELYRFEATLCTNPDNQRQGQTCYRGEMVYANGLRTNSKMRCVTGIPRAQVPTPSPEIRFQKSN